MKYDVQAANAIAADYAAGDLPKIIDTGASFSNTIYPNAQYGVSLDGLATADITVTVSAGNTAEGTDKKNFLKLRSKKEAGSVTLLFRLFRGVTSLHLQQASTAARLQQASSTALLLLWGLV